MNYKYDKKIKTENYEINSNSDHVLIWSQSKPVFEPKGWKKEMREEIKKRIKNLEPMTKKLYAAYTYNKNEFCDVENILLYNIGTPIFNKFKIKDILFEKKIKNQTKNKSKKPHFIEYKTKEKTQSQYWNKRKKLGEWNIKAVEKINSSLKPHDYWYMMKTNNTKKFGIKPYKSSFGIELKIDKPSNKKVNILNLIKPMLDGIISNFHSHKIKNKDKTIQILANKLKINQNKTKSLLINNSILGKVDLIQKFKEKGIRWNPSDHLCDYIKISLTEKENKWSIKGTLWALKPK